MERRETVARDDYEAAVRRNEMARRREDEQPEEVESADGELEGETGGEKQLLGVKKRPADIK